MGQRRARNRRAGLATVFAALIVVAAAGIGVEPSLAAQQDTEMSGISGTADAPRRHFRLRDPARLSGEETQRIYDIVTPALQRGYASSGDPAAAAYLGWKRFNTMPYLSATHGNHYVNNYANTIASPAYARFEQAGRLAVGSVLAKDSFSVTRSSGILLGPLFLMEKMPEGFSPVSGDWRYSQVMPDGEVLGRTGGPGAQRVEYCVGCHLARESNDHLYFIPEDRRIPSR